MLLNEIISTIKNAERIALLPHVSIDGDSLGSSIAMALALKEIGKDVTVFFEEELPYVYSFLPGKQLGEVYKNTNERYDVAICIDCADIERLGKRIEVFKNSVITVNIDHHGTNTEFAFYNHIESSAAAAGEIVYRIIKMMGITIDIDMAVCMYVAISTDTGGFRYSNTKAITHLITAELIDIGIDVANISGLIFDNIKLEKLRLMGKAIENVELFENGKVAFILLTDELMKATGATDEDCDGIVNLARNIEGVEVGALIRKKNEEQIKVSLRSKSYVNVAAVAGLFKGGGHMRAAGFSIKGDVREIKETLLNDLKEVL